MALAEKLLRQLDDPKLTHDERVMLRCQAAAELEHRGQYEAARQALGQLWQGTGVRPVLNNLDERTSAEALLRVGTLTGWLGSVNQIKDAQEKAKDLINESMRLFQTIGETDRAAAAQSELGICYWREGAYAEARVVMEEAFSRTHDKEQKAKALLRHVTVEFSASRFHDALQILTDAASMFHDESTDHALKGRFHGLLALVLSTLGLAESRQDYKDQAIIEYTAAIFEFEQAGHTSYQARAENDIAFLLYSVGRFDEAQEHLHTARRLFSKLQDKGSTAQVDETRARVLLAQGRVEEAERVIRESVSVLEHGGQQSLLAESLITQGVVLARLGHHAESGDALRRAMEVAETAGALEDGGVAALTMLEEHGERLSAAERQELYLRADGWLKRTQDASHASRLRECARRMVELGRTAIVVVKQTGTGAVAVEAGETRADGEGLAVFVCEDQGTRELVEVARQFAGTKLPLLVSGESGVGKEALAQAIHDWSGRAGKFVTFDCAGIDAEDLESELFGHGGGQRGSSVVVPPPAGAESLRDEGSRARSLRDGEGAGERARVYAGVVREAEGGTLFVEEIGELDWVSQGRLLRLLDRGEVATAGAATTEAADVRIVASARGELGQLVARGKFRQDLYYRFEAFEIKLPPLRERPADIAALARHFAELFGARAKRELRLSDEAVAALRKLPLVGGNVRELRGIIARAVMLSKDEVISEETLELALRHRSGRATAADPWAGFTLTEEVRRYEAQFIERALKDAHGSVTAAARLLGFRHHQSLSSLINLKHRHLLELRTPIKPRRRSIIKW